MWQKQTVIPPEELPPQARQSRFNTSITSMRVHELAVQRWLNRRFLVAEGFPMPVLFTTPANAYSDFKSMWQEGDAAFSYLLNLKDSSGKPLYQPYPSPPSYPLISIKRVSWSYVNKRSFAANWWRHAGYPTVASNVTMPDVANVYQTRMPQGWDYRLQIDHYSTKPAGQAHFIQEWQLGMMTSASQPNTWIKAVYPGVFGKKLIRVVQESAINDLTEEEVAEGSIRIYRTSVNIVVEGWVVDPDNIVIPAFWTEVDRVKAVSPGQLEEIYNMIDRRYDLRGSADNDVINTTAGLPPQINTAE